MHGPGLRVAPSPAPPRLRGEVGSSAPAYIVAVGLSLMFFVLLVQFVAWQYGRGVVRSALDEGARSGAPAEAGPGVCEARARDVLGDLLGGAMGDGISVRCIETATEVVAEARVRFRAWMAPSPDWTFRVAATARKETLP